MIDINFRKRKRGVGLRWRLDETYIKVNGKFCYLYRAFDKEGKTIDLLLAHRRLKIAAHRFIKWRITNGVGYKSFKSASVTISGTETV